MTSQTLAVLRVMVDDPTASFYGLELADAIRLKTGTVYPILARLERFGWVESEKELVDPKEAGRPARRLYRLTAAGERAARQALDEQLAQLRPRSGRADWGLRPGSQPA
jgi:DNA-binding PadR family transcriptional regulator